MKEKHIALIQNQVAPTSSSANEIKVGTFKSFPLNTFHHFKVIGCDGTSTNTGANGGIIILIEKHFGPSVHRVLRLLHTNELPFRHLLIK